MSYQPIENYGIIGNMRTVALVGMNGSIDWYCHPRFDSPSIFGAILDDKKGGDSKSPPALTVSGTSSDVMSPKRLQVNLGQRWQFQNCLHTEQF